jgi:nicotinate phosphoribosyltransferase
MKNNSALQTDFYELTMMQGYYRCCREEQVVFDMFFRSQPYGGGFSVCAGLDDLLCLLQELRFSGDDIDFLSSTGVFTADFLSYLKGFRFRGSIYAVEEGEIVFPNEPLIRVHGSMLECQLIESLLLNIINFQTLIATKAARIYNATGAGTLLEFGLRRAQGPDGAFSATRASYIGGAGATSNSYAGKVLGIPVKGTMAHSWIMAFESEEEAFRRFADLYPDSAILLIDTYDTLGSGIENAIKIGLEQKKKNKPPIGVRLDSGDLSYLSGEVRKRLDKAGLEDAKITVSNELDETIIHQLLADGAPIDAWGVGTKLVTGGNSSSLTGVYKLSAKGGTDEMQPVIKISNNPNKTTNPGIKQVYRFSRRGSGPVADLITRDYETPECGRPYRFYHPSIDGRFFTISDYDDCRPLLTLKMKDGKRSAEPKELSELRQGCIGKLERLDQSYKRIINPHIYKVSLSEEMKNLKRKLLSDYSSRKQL